jgi:hypothetical protein
MTAMLVRQLKRAAKTRASLRSERREKEARALKRAAASLSLDWIESLVDTIYHDTHWMRGMYMYSMTTLSSISRDKSIEQYWSPDSRILH